MSNKTPHKHAKVIKAWADGETVQRLDPKDSSNIWEDVDSPVWWAHYEYRIKPEPKPDVVKFANVYKDCVGFFHRTLDEADREADPQSIGVLKITINGETGKVSVEVV